MNGDVGKLRDKAWSRKLIVFGIIMGGTIANSRLGHIVPADEWRDLMEFAGKYLIAQGFADGVAPLLKTVLEKRNGTKPPAPPGENAAEPART